MLKNGYTLMHEHIKIDLSKVKNDQDCRLDCFDETVKEFKELYNKGVRNIVEVTNIGMGRDIDYIKAVVKASGINIITSTGCYKDPFIEAEIQAMDVETLAQLFIKEIVEGYQNDEYHADMIGEIGTSKNLWTDNEKRLFDAAIIAHKVTNKPIYTHTTLGTLAYEQAEYLKSKNVQMDKVVIGHIDLLNNMDIILAVIKTGANVGFDTIGKINYLADEKRIEMLGLLKKEQLLDHVVLSLDLTRKSHLKYLGGIGYTYLFDTFIPMLKASGFDDNDINKMLIDNPQRIMG